MSDNFVASPFDAIRRYDNIGNEYWSARDLCKLLGYSTWQKFQSVIEQAKIACENSRQATSDHFNLEVNLITAGKGAKKSNDTHYEVGREVRDTIKRLGGTMPEHLPKPEKSVDQLEKERKLEIQKFLQRREQPQLPAFKNEE